jgi:hypothetical protein
MATLLSRDGSTCVNRVATPTTKSINTPAGFARLLPTNLMPCRYAIDVEHKLVVSRAWDRVTFAEVDAHQDKLASDPDFNPEFKQLVDATEVTNLDISIDEAKAVFARKTFSPSSRCAFLGRGLSVLGMGRLIEAQAALMGGRETVRVFSDRDKALKWLGIENFAALL